MTVYVLPLNILEFSRTLGPQYGNMVLLELIRT